MLESHLRKAIRSSVATQREEQYGAVIGGGFAQGDHGFSGWESVGRRQFRVRRNLHGEEQEVSQRRARRVPALV